MTFSECKKCGNKEKEYTIYSCRKCGQFYGCYKPSGFLSESKGCAKLIIQQTACPSCKETSGFFSSFYEALGTIN